MGRQRWLATVGIILAVTVGGLTLVRAEERGTSWTARLSPTSWFSKRVPEAQRDAKGEPVKEKQADINAARRLQAELDWKRRSEICQKLRQIALDTNDDELDRFAERLDQRAWDVYSRQLEGGGPAFVGERIGIDFN